MTVDVSNSPNLILTCDVDFFDLATEELFTAAADAEIVATVEDGVMAIYVPNGFVDLAERWRKAPPIFVRHICPVNVIAPLRASRALSECTCTTCPSAAAVAHDGAILW